MMVDAHAARSGLCIVGFYQVGGGVDMTNQRLVSLGYTFRGVWPVVGHPICGPVEGML